MRCISYEAPLGLVASFEPIECMIYRRYKRQHFTWHPFRWQAHRRGLGADRSRGGRGYPQWPQASMDDHEVDDKQQRDKWDPDPGEMIDEFLDQRIKRRFRAGRGHLDPQRPFPKGNFSGHPIP